MNLWSLRCENNGILFPKYTDYKYFGGKTEQKKKKERILKGFHSLSLQDSSWLAIRTQVYLKKKKMNEKTHS